VWWWREPLRCSYILLIWASWLIYMCNVKLILCKYNMHHLYKIFRLLFHSEICDVLRGERIGMMWWCWQQLPKCFYILLICEPWLIHMCNTQNMSCVLNTCFIYHISFIVPFLDVCCTNRRVYRHDDVVNSRPNASTSYKYMYHDSSICVTYLHMCDI